MNFETRVFSKRLGKIKYMLDVRDIVKKTLSASSIQKFTINHELVDVILHSTGFYLAAFNANLPFQSQRENLFVIRSEV